MSVDLTPSKQGYTYMLKIVSENSESVKDRAWAKAELQKIEAGSKVPKRSE